MAEKRQIQLERYTNLPLGENWAGEWPAYVLVHHEGSVDDVRYVPERTCRPGVASDGCGAWGVYCPECGHTLSGPHASRELAKRYAARRDIMPRYCPNCGARIEEAAS